MKNFQDVPINEVRHHLFACIDKTKRIACEPGPKRASHIRRHLRSRALDVTHAVTPDVAAFIETLVQEWTDD